MLGENLAGLGLHDHHDVVVDHQFHSLEAVVSANSQVVELAGPAQCDLAEPIDDVSADSKMLLALGTFRFRLHCRLIAPLGCLHPECLMRPGGVVDFLELIELGLQLQEVLRAWLLREPLLEGAVKPLDLSLRLRMGGRSVLLDDLQLREQIFKAVLAADEARGVDVAVVGQRGKGRAVLISALVEGGGHYRPGNGAECTAAEQHARVVIEPVDDLDITSIF